MEEWKDIPHYEGYQVSNKGRVRTKGKTTYNQKHGLRKWKDRILHYKSKNYKTGYKVDLWKEGKPKTFLVARLVAFTFYEEDINNHELTVDHIDGNRFNNNLKNLELVSLKENIQRAFRNNLIKTQTAIKITNKKDNSVEKFRSMSTASAYIKHNKGYISGMLKKGKNENKDYKWELI